MTTKQTQIEEIRDSIKSIWLHRKSNQTHANVQDVIDALYPKDNLKPLITHKKREGDVWKFTIFLPAGIGFEKFKKDSNLFADATGGHVHIEKRGKIVTMEVMTEELKKSYPFSSFDPKKYEDMFLPIPIGMSAKGLIVRDLTSYPHLLVAGETNFGKSNALHVIANSMLLYRPNTLLIMIDPKSTEFAYLNDHNALVIDEMDMVENLLKELNKEMDKRKRILKNASCVKISKYLDKGFEMPFIVLIIDEWADVPENVQDDLWRLLRMGRFVGIHIIAATQRPSSKVFEKFGDLKAMFLGRLCFVVADAINSRMILDSDEAAYLPAIAGRAIYKCGLEKMEVQTLFLDPDEAEKLYQNNDNICRVVNPIVLSLKQPQVRLLPR